MTVTLTHPFRAAAAMGTDAGKAAASWAWNGNTANHIYAAFLAGFEDGDPQIMDYYAPGYPLSGEWADGLSLFDLVNAVTPDGIDYWSTSGEDSAAIGDAFEAAFNDAYWAELQRVALLHTSPDTDD